MLLLYCEVRTLLQSALLLLLSDLLTASELNVSAYRMASLFNSFSFSQDIDK